MQAFFTPEIKVRHEVLNDLLTAAKLYSPLVKNGILEKVKRNNKNNNIDCFEGSDDYGLVRVTCKY